MGVKQPNSKGQEYTSHVMGVQGKYYDVYLNTIRSCNIFSPRLVATIEISINRGQPPFIPFPHLNTSQHHPHNVHFS